MTKFPFYRDSLEEVYNFSVNTFVKYCKHFGSVCVDSLIEGRQFTDRPGTNMRHRVTYWTVVHPNVYSIYHPCNPRAPRV